VTQPSMTRVAALLLVSRCAVASGWAAEAPVALSIAIPQREDGTRRVITGRPNEHFHVLLSSRTGPLRVWDDAFSWGYYALSFELVGEHGDVRTIHKKPMDFTVNFPAWLRLEPPDHLVFDVFLGDRKIWDGVPQALPTCERVQLRAIYEVKEDAHSAELHVWTGRVVSELTSVMLCQ
jgi:hypothetical protein